MNVREVGSFIRSQRTTAKMSLRKLSGLVGVSIPYLSQVERGLRKPSADILQAIAKGLRVSAETLYIKAGILEDRPVPDVASAIMADQSITERQRQALLQIYEAFRQETGRDGGAESDAAGAESDAGRAEPLPAATSSAEPTVGPQPGPRRRTPGRTAKRSTGSSRRTEPKRGGRTKTTAVPPHPAPLRPPAIQPRKEV